MEIIALVSILVLTLAVLIRFRCKNNEIDESKRLIQEAQERSKKRQFEKSMSGNDHSDPYYNSIDFNTALCATEIDDIYDGRGKLSESQKETIRLIFAKHAGIPEKSSPMPFTSAAAIVGMPLSSSIFDENNIIENIVLDDAWADNKRYK